MFDHFKKRDNLEHVVTEKICGTNYKERRWENIFDTRLSWQGKMSAQD